MNALPHWTADPAAPSAKPMSPSARCPEPGFDPTHATSDTASQRLAQKSKMRQIIESKDAQSVGLKPVDRIFKLDAVSHYWHLLYDVVYALTFGLFVIPAFMLFAVFFAGVLWSWSPSIFALAQMLGHHG